MEWLSDLFTFRNGNHLTYFLFTFPVVVLYGVTFIIGANSRPYLYFLPFMVVMYVAIAIRAYQVVVVRKQQSEVFSIDCIWYNSLLAVSYSVMLAVSIYQEVKASA